MIQEKPTIRSRWPLAPLLSPKRRLKGGNPKAPDADVSASQASASNATTTATGTSLVSPQAAGSPSVPAAHKDSQINGAGPGTSAGAGAAAGGTPKANRNGFFSMKGGSRNGQVHPPAAEPWPRGDYPGSIDEVKHRDAWAAGLTEDGIPGSLPEIHTQEGVPLWVGRGMAGGAPMGAGGLGEFGRERELEHSSSDSPSNTVALGSTRSNSSMTSDDSEEERCIGSSLSEEDTDSTAKRARQLGHQVRPPSWAVDPKVAFRSPLAHQPGDGAADHLAPGTPRAHHLQRPHTPTPQQQHQHQQAQQQQQQQHSQGSAPRPPPWAVESKGYRAAALGSAYGLPSSHDPGALPETAHLLMFGGEEAAPGGGVGAGQGQQVGLGMTPFWDMQDGGVGRGEELRIVSLVGAATDVICALGLEETLVARSHECVPSGSVGRLPCVTSPGTSNQGEAGKHRGVSVDAAAIIQLQPSIIILQEACDLCSVSLKDFQGAVKEQQTHDPNLDPYCGAQLITIRPFMMSDIWDGVRTIAEAVGRQERGQRIVEELKLRWAAVRQMVPRRRRAQRVRVACLGELQPLAGSGYWIPEIVACAGGIHIAGKAGERTEALSMELLTQRDPDIIVIACRGLVLREALEALVGLPDLGAWDNLTAVRTGRVYIVDGSRYFNSPGPRVVDSVEVMADVLQRDYAETSGQDSDAESWTGDGRASGTEGGDRGGAPGAGGLPPVGSFGSDEGLASISSGGSGPLGGGADKPKPLPWKGRTSGGGGGKSGRVWPLHESLSPAEQLQQAVATGAAFARLPGNSTAEWRAEIPPILQSTASLASQAPSASQALTPGLAPGLVPGGVGSSASVHLGLGGLSAGEEGAQAVSSALGSAAEPNQSRPEQLRQLLMKTISQYLPVDGILLSGGIGSSVLAHCAHSLGGDPIGLAITVLAGSKASDRSPAAAAAGVYGLEHIVVGGSVRPESLLSSELRFVVRTLKTFDPAEVRAGIAMAAALREAKRRGCTCLITGDGADELFSAFEFLSGMSEEKAYQCRKHVQETMRFPVVDLARAMGIQVRQPFLHPSVREFALGLSKSELQCEGHELLSSWAAKFAESKLLLRLAFPEVEASQRRSDAIEVGAGTYVLTKRLLKRMGREEFEKNKQRVLWEDVVDLRDAEQLHYFQAFRDEFEGLLIPGVQRWGLNACLSCGYPPLFEGQLACTTCGEYPARRLTKLVMEGWEGKAVEEKYSPALQQKMLSQVMPKGNVPPGLPRSPASPSWKKGDAGAPLSEDRDAPPPTTPPGNAPPRHGPLPPTSPTDPNSPGSSAGAGAGTGGSSGGSPPLGSFQGGRQPGSGLKLTRVSIGGRGAGAGAGAGAGTGVAATERWVDARTPVPGGGAGERRGGEVGFDELFALHEVFLVLGNGDDGDSLPNLLDHVRDGLLSWRATWPADLAVC